jgi:hypothetical protein
MPDQSDLARSHLSICRSCDYFGGEKGDSTVTCVAAAEKTISLTGGRCKLNKWIADPKARPSLISPGRLFTPRLTNIYSEPSPPMAQPLLEYDPVSTPARLEDLGGYFDRVVVINLRRRPDRLARFWGQLKRFGWPFKQPEVFDAVDSEKVPVPVGWRDGGGAWGCMQSHRQVLERAMMDGVQSLLVLEDDVCLRAGFIDELCVFLGNVPNDWEQLMLGGQHMHNKPVPVRPGVARCFNCQRTHAYAVRGQFMRDLYSVWCASTGHCDHVMGPFQTGRRVYAPGPFIFGQEKGKSDISGSLNPKKFWVPPAESLPVVLLHAPPAILPQLRGLGFHTGHRRNPQTDIDLGLEEVFALAKTDEELTRRLTAWIDMIQWEVASDHGTVCTVWHPKATLPLVTSSTPRNVVECRAETVEEAMANLPESVRSQLTSPDDAAANPRPRQGARA